MIRPKLIFLALLASASSTFAGEERLENLEPVWELRLGLREHADFGLGAWFRDRLPPTGEIAADGQLSSIRLTGVNDPAGGKAGWLLELRGVKNIGEVRTRLEKHSPPDEAGRFVIHADNGPFAAWIEGADVLHWAFPAANSGAEIPSSIATGNGEFLSGWIDLAKTAAGQTSSKLLKITRHVSFSAAVHDETLAIQLDLRFKDTLGAAAFQERFSLLQHSIQSILGDGRGPSLTLETSPDRDGLRVGITLDRAQIEELKRFIDETLAAPAENPTPNASPSEK